MGVQRLNPVWRAEYFLELRRYFSSHIYVSNTLVVYVLMLACVAALTATGNERIAEAMQLPEEEIRRMLRVSIPFLLAFFAAMEIPRRSLFP